MTYPPVEMFSSLLPLLCVFSHVLSAPAVNIRIRKKGKTIFFFQVDPESYRMIHLFDPESALMNLLKSEREVVKKINSFGEKYF